MELRYNGNIIRKVNYNGQKVNYINMDGTQVFRSWSDILRDCANRVDCITEGKRYDKITWDKNSGVITFNYSFDYFRKAVSAGIAIGFPDVIHPVYSGGSSFTFDYDVSFDKDTYGQTTVGTRFLFHKNIQRVTSNTSFASGTIAYTNSINDGGSQTGALNINVSSETKGGSFMDQITMTVRVYNFFAQNVAGIDMPL